jgi:micrococcal nuclease
MKLIKFKIFSRFLVMVLCLGFILGGCTVNHSDKGIAVKINKVISGQTIEIILNNQPVKVRLLGLDTPDRQQKTWAENSKQELIKILTNNYQQTLKQVNINLSANLAEKDAYNRINGYIWHKGKLINEQLIESGYAVANLTYTDGEYDQELILAQDYARIMEKGVWNPQQPLRQLTIDD